MSNPQNLTIEEPHLKDLLDMHKRDILLSMNCHAIATIQSFDKDKQTCTAVMNYTKTFYQKNSSGNYDPVQVAYPLLVDVPVIVSRGGLSGIRFPIKQGDVALICFNDRDIDNWFKGANTGPVASNRLHSFSDGIAIVGLSSMANPISGYGDDAVFWNDKTKVSLTPTTATIGNDTTTFEVSTKIKLANSTGTLNSLLQELCTELETLAGTIVPAPGNPLNPAVAAQLIATATKIGSLLE